MAATSHLLLNQETAAHKIPGNFMETTSLRLLSSSYLRLKGDMQLTTSRRCESNPHLDLTDRTVTRNFTVPKAPKSIWERTDPGCGPREPDDRNSHGLMMMCS